MAILVLERRRRRDERATGRDRHSPYSPDREKTGDPFQGDTKIKKRYYSRPFRRSLFEPF